MRYSGIFLLFAVLVCIFTAGCTQQTGAGSVAAQVPPVSGVPVQSSATPAPEQTATAVPTAVATDTPQQVVTVIHQVSLTRDVKDSELLFTLQVPVEWNVSTFRLENPENFLGFMYETDLGRNNSFYIHTFTNYRSRDQNYRDDCRGWSPAPEMSTVVINGITFDRYESTANGRTNVTYVSRSSSMNEAGYVSVLAFSANNNNRFEKEDFDTVVQSFRYLTKETAGSAPGEEIYRVPPEEMESGGVRSSSGTRAAASSSKSSGGSCPLRR